MRKFLRKVIGKLISGIVITITTIVTLVLLLLFLPILGVMVVLKSK